MGTRSRIGLKLKDQIISVYHHWDGYPSWLGVTLEKKFNTREKIEELIDGGDMSSCDSEYGWDYNYNTGEGKREVTAPTYYSERGEDCPPKISESITEYLDQTERTDGEYAYLFDNGSWTCYDIGQYGSGVKGEILDIPADFPVEMAS